MQAQEIIVKCRVSAEDQTRFKQAADKQGISLSDWMRLHLKAAAQIVLEKAVVPRTTTQKKPSAQQGKRGKLTNV